MKRYVLVLTLVCAAVLARAASLVTYPAPKGAPLNGDFRVRVRLAGGEWQRVDTYLWKVDRVEAGRHKAEPSSVAYFDFDGTVEVEVTSLKGRIDSCRVRPLSYGIAANVSGDRLTFTLDRPRMLSVEVNGDIFHNLQLFANAPQPKVKKDKNVRYYGPGYYDLKGDSIHLKTGETLFIDGGAYIKGYVSTYGSDNVRIVGHGIVNPERQQAGIMVRYSKNVTVDGPVTTQLPVGGSDGVSVSNAKCISWYGWGDGMNVFASNNVTYNHVFCRTSDDCSTIYCTRLGYHGGCRGIKVTDAVYWADVAHPIMIGLHGDISRNEIIENVVYEDVDILDQAEKQIDYQGCIGINNGDNILVRDVTFRRFRVESLRCGMLFNFRVCFNQKYCSAPGRGIENVTVDGLTYNGRQPNMSIMAGYNEERKIKGVKINGLVINGTPIYDTMPGKPAWYKTADFANIFIGEHVEGVTFNQ